MTQPPSPPVAGSPPEPRQGRRVRFLVAAVAATALLVLAAACSGSGGSPAADGSNLYAKALRYAQCMRSHGEPDWPDPTSTGSFSTNGINLNSPQFAAASSACQSLAPAGISFQLSGAEQQSLLSSALKFSECMRAHRITNFPDPSPTDIDTSGGGIGITQSLSGSGITSADTHSPLFQSANKACLLSTRGGGNS